MIYVIGNDPGIAHDLASQINYFGYDARVLSHPSEVGAAVANQPPSALIMELALAEPPLGGAEALARIQAGRTTPLPVIFLASRGDLNTRLRAVRAGGHAYFTQPVDVAALVGQLDLLTTRNTTEPYRILIVEDDPLLAAGYAATLRQAGMTTEIVSEPTRILSSLVEFAPDLILMDVRIPDFDSLELAAVIRQQEAYITLPIVFLSTRADRAKELEVLSLGGDDFLDKPLRPDHLIASVTSRAQRSRILRSLMVRDGLTGLLNHTHTKERLAVEVARARRHSGRVAFAMIDIDHFKEVNDRFGHSTGDRVLKSLARLLQQRFRKTDIIGRYGGEEFAVILDGIDGSAALKIVDALRVSFSAVRHQAAESYFSVTFSGGIATFPRFGDATALNEAADKALYEAKRTGRNRVVLAD